MNTTLYSNIYFWNGHAFFIGNLPETDEHSHHAVEMFIGLKREVTIFSKGEIYNSRILILNTDVPHSVGDYKDEKIVLVFDPESDVAQILANSYLKSKHIYSFDNKQTEDFFSKFHNFSCKGYTCESAEHLYKSIISWFLKSKISVKSIDNRIGMALDFLRTIEIKKISIKNIAEETGLSESHLMHLFKKQIGIPIRRYLLWLRLLDALRLVLSGSSLTDAAHAVCFSDSAHLSRTFREMFGITISTIFKNRRFVQVFSCLP